MNTLLTFERFQDIIRRHAPPLPPIRQRTTFQKLGTAKDLVSAAWNGVTGELHEVVSFGRLPRIGSFSLPLLKLNPLIKVGYKVIAESYQALAESDRRNEAIAEIFGYTDTLARMAVAMPDHPRGRSASLPAAIVPKP